MYIPAHFAGDDATTLELLAEHGAADLITLTADGLLATMLPFAYEPAAGAQGVHDAPGWGEVLVRRLTIKHEAARLTPPGHPPAWSVDDAPRAFIEGQLRAIVGLELQITRIEAKAKLSQNRPVGDVAGGRAGLPARGDARGGAAVRHANDDRVRQPQAR